jgi:hypothetical protein
MLLLVKNPLDVDAVDPGDLWSAFIVLVIHLIANCCNDFSLFGVGVR